METKTKMYSIKQYAKLIGLLEATVRDNVNRLRGLIQA